MSQTYSSLDLQVRLQLSGQKYTELLSSYIDSLRWGKRNINKLEDKLTLLSVYIELLSDYTACECGLDCTNNCLTLDGINSVCINIEKITGLCFQPLGFNYIGDQKQGGIGKIQIGCNFIVS